MKTTITSSIIGAFTFATLANLTAQAGSPWISIESYSDTNTKIYIQRHNKQGRYRAFTIRAEQWRTNRKEVFTHNLEADCHHWRERYRGTIRWDEVMPDTYGDAKLRYVCS